MKTKLLTYGNNCLVIAAFTSLLVLGLCVDSSPYRQSVSAGNLLAVPMVVVSYGIPNWCLLAVLATFIGEGRKRLGGEWDLPSMWTTATFTGLITACGVIFGGSYLAPEKMLSPDQTEYMLIAGPLLLAGFGLGAWGESAVKMMRSGG